MANDNYMNQAGQGRSDVWMENESFQTEDDRALQRFAELYEWAMQKRKDEDYIVNQPQMNKLIDVLEFFMDMAQKCHGSVEPVFLRPREEHGGVTANFTVFDLYGEDLRRYCEIMQYVSAMTIDAGMDGVCISVTVPYVFVERTAAEGYEE